MFWLQTLKFPEPLSRWSSTQFGSIAARAASMFATAIISMIERDAPTRNAEYG
jgi:hypothetical protein